MDSERIQQQRQDLSRPDTGAEEEGIPDPDASPPERAMAQTDDQGIAVNADHEDDPQLADYAGLSDYSARPELEPRGERLSRRLSREEPDPTLEIPGRLPPAGDAPTGRLRASGTDAAREDEVAELLAEEELEDRAGLSAEEGAIHAIDQDELERSERDDTVP
jgi:hypothetical protein